MNFFSSISDYFSASDDVATPADTTSEPAADTTPTPEVISSDGQLNRSDYALPDHPVAQAHFDAVRGTVEEKYAENPDVLALSDRMGDERVAYSASHPEASDKDVIHHMQAEDAKMQFAAGSEGEISGEEARMVPRTSIAPFLDSILDEEKRPETLDQAVDAATAAAVGLAGLMMNGEGPRGD